jgi:hypothetical protein
LTTAQHVSNRTADQLDSQNIGLLGANTGY